MTTSTKREVAIPVAVVEFVKRLQTADWDGMEQHLTADVLYDATVPAWHYQYEGASRVMQEYREEWTGNYRWTVQVQQVVATQDQIALCIEALGTPIRDDGPPPAVCRLANFFRLEDDRIAEHRFYCGGEWDPETVRNIAEYAPKAEGRTS